MDLINNLSLGFGVAFTFQNLIYCFVGCLLGTLIGVLPGIGPVATIAHSSHHGPGRQVTNFVQTSTYLDLQDA